MPRQLIPKCADRIGAAKCARLRLRKNVVFHDGTPVKASDVVYSLGRLLRKNKGAAWMFVNIMDPSGAVAVDDRTVTFKLKTPFAPLPLILPSIAIAG